MNLSIGDGVHSVATDGHVSREVHPFEDDGRESRPVAGDHFRKDINEANKKHIARLRVVCVPAPLRAPMHLFVYVHRTLSDYTQLIEPFYVVCACVPLVVGDHRHDCTQ